MKVIVWSKNRCAWCDKAKSLLGLRGIPYEERNIDVDWTPEQLFEAHPGVKTIPQISIDGTHIGGYRELEAYLQKKTDTDGCPWDQWRPAR